MKSICVARILLIVAGAVSCTKSNQIHLIPRGPLDGVWAGFIETKELGKCIWPGWYPGRTEVQINFIASNAKITAVVRRPNGSGTELIGSFDGDTVRITETRSVYCNGSSGAYLSRYKGVVNGNTLALTGTDTLCPVQGCISQRTLTLKRY